MFSCLACPARSFLALVIWGALGCDGEVEQGCSSEAGSADKRKSSLGCFSDPRDKSDWVWTEGASETEDEASEIFRQEAPLEIRLTIDPETWRQLNENAIEMDEERLYRVAQVSLGGVALGGVGVRPKGGRGTLRACFDEEGELLCNKLSYKLKFAEVLKNQKFLGLASLNLHSGIRDPSMMRDYMAYGLYRRMGVKAPRTGYAEVFVNDELLGLYVLVEQVDETFLRSRFPLESEGNLYKGLWPSGRHKRSYDGRLRTNEKDSDHSGLSEFQESLESASDAELPEVLKTWMDPILFDRMNAVDETIMKWDGPLTFVMTPDASDEYRNHNFYLYQQRPDRFVFIPWDMDSSFERKHPRVAEFPLARDLSIDCERARIIPAKSGDNEYLVPSCDPLIRALALSDLEDGIHRLEEGPYSAEQMHARIDWVMGQLRRAVQRDETMDENSWSRGVQELKEDISYLHERMRSLAQKE